MLTYLLLKGYFLGRSLVMTLVRLLCMGLKVNYTPRQEFYLTEKAGKGLISLFRIMHYQKSRFQTYRRTLTSQRR